MATVFRAEDLKNHRPVALKVLRPDIAAMIGAERFRREIEIAARLQHPHILPLYDSDEAGGFLYYIMPLVDGGTLKDRLQQGPRASVAEALAVVQQVAQGLAYAHAQGLVHRDIKPANILLSSDHAFVGDFGIARIVRQAMSVNEQLTESGLVIGTPTYMAPEQLRGATGVDGRADQYSLACVLYEMLVGNPPSPAARGADTLQQSLRKARPELSSAVFQAIIKALAQDRDSRFPTISAFTAALSPGLVIRTEELLPRFLRRTRPRVRWMLLGASGLAVSAALWFLTSSGTPTCPGLSRSDTTRYAVFPFDHQDGPQGVSEEQLLGDAFERWHGVTVVDQFQLREVVGRRSEGELRLDQARDIACKVGVTRFVLGNVGRMPFGDSLRIMARLYDFGPGDAPIGRAGLRIATSLDGADSLFGVLADSLLFRGNPPVGGLARAGTTVLAARQAFDSGQRALSSWDLVASDSAFRNALAMDPDYVAANLWLALVRLWQRREPALWLTAAQRAASSRGVLRATDSLMAQAVLAMGNGRIERACPLWRTLTHVEPMRFTAWYGLGECLQNDSIVIRDARSPSGWRFRASYQEAQRAYLTATRLLPSILAAPGNSVSDLSESFLYLSATQHRKGQAAPPDPTSFLAAPGWEGDSLVFIPYPRSPSIQAPSPVAERTDEAVRRQRLLLDTLALTWVTEAPRSIDARLALIEAMALAVDPAAVDTARGARGLARDTVALVRAIDAEIRTLIQFGVPDRSSYLDRARALADSVLDIPSLGQSADPSVVATLAALTGRARLAADAARRFAARPDWDLPKPLLEAAPGLLMYTAMGGPADSIRTLWRRTRDAIEQGLPPQRRLERAMEDLGRPATLAFPAETLPPLRDLRGKGDWLLTLQASFADGDRGAVLRWADSMAHSRSSAASTFDTAWPVAELLVAAGDTALATAWLEENLASIRFRPYASFGNPVEVATMIRAMMLRAELAHRGGDARSAGRWSTAIVALWGGADPTFDGDLELIRRLAR